MKTDTQFKLRIPAELKEKLDASAVRNERSLTAEIVARLEQTFAPVLEVQLLKQRLEELRDMNDQKQSLYDQIEQILARIKTENLQKGSAEHTKLKDLANALMARAEFIGSLAESTQKDIDRLGEAVQRSLIFTLPT